MPRKQKKNRLCVRCRHIYPKKIMRGTAQGLMCPDCRKEYGKETQNRKLKKEIPQYKISHHEEVNL